MFTAYQKAAQFETYDPNYSSFDPRIMNRADGAGASGYITQGAKPGQKMQITVSMNNATASTLTFELWYWLASMNRVRNANFATGNYQYIPQTSYQGISAIAAGTDGTVGFDQSGNCIIRGAGPTPGPADPVGTISCKEIPYASFFEASAITPFIVSMMRMTVTTDPQFDEIVTWKTRTYAGGEQRNTISPRAYVVPEQNQDNIADITVSYDVGMDRGLEIPVLSGENVRLALFVSFWTNQQL